MEALSFELTIDDRKKPKPFTIRKRLDETTPALSKAFHNKQMFRQAIATFRKPKPDGSAGTIAYLRIRFVQASISKIRWWSPESINPAESRTPELEEIEFTYLQAIQEFVDS